MEKREEIAPKGRKKVLPQEQTSSKGQRGGAGLILVNVNTVQEVGLSQTASAPEGDEPSDDSDLNLLADAAMLRLQIQENTSLHQVSTLSLTRLLQSFHWGEGNGSPL